MSQLSKRKCTRLVFHDTLPFAGKAMSLPVLWWLTEREGTLALLDTTEIKSFRVKEAQRDFALVSGTKKKFSNVDRRCQFYKTVFFVHDRGSK